MLVINEVCSRLQWLNSHRKSRWSLPLKNEKQRPRGSRCTYTHLVAPCAAINGSRDQSSMHAVRLLERGIRSRQERKVPRNGTASLSRRLGSWPRTPRVETASQWVFRGGHNQQLRTNPIVSPALRFDVYIRMQSCCYLQFCVLRRSMQSSLMCQVCAKCVIFRRGARGGVCH